MTRFAPELRELADRLEVPQPMRARILLELHGDLEDLDEALRREGVPPDEARRRAVAMLVPDSEAVAELERCHRPLWLRLVDRFSDPVRHGVERVLLALCVSLLFVLGFVGLRDADLFADPAPLVVPLLGIGLATLAVGVWKLFQLYVRKNHGLPALRRGLGFLPFAGLAALVLSVGGAALDLYAVAGNLAASGGGAETLLGWLRRDTAMASLGLLIATLAGGLWLWVAAGVARIEQMDVDLMLNFDPGGER